ncbi:MAG: D-3-phosphoglycerate dehydrogenase [Parcubacteria bacterium C7867-008]|nr:MAG: D-3-phosphoglycerate dehydrogenase [Parcubacteria bacterium C7867-008]
MKIAVLSFSFLKPKHLEKLRSFGEVIEYQSTNNAPDATERVKSIEIAIADCWDVPMDKTFFESSPDLKYVSLNSTGFNQVDIEAAKAHGVAISNVPGYSTEGVAEQTLGLMLAVARHIPKANQEMMKAPFQIDPANRNHDVYQGVELRGKTLGVFGLGQIGLRVAELGNALGMRVIGCTRSPKQMPNIEIVDFYTLLEESDFLAITSAFSAEMKGLFNENTFSKMKPSAILINTARGDFVEETALSNALKSNKIYGYGADVLTDWSVNNPILGMERVVLSPHSAFFTQESADRLADSVIANVEAYIQGKPINVITI